MRQWEVLKILVKRGRCRANDVKTILRDRNLGDHRRLLALVAGRSRLKGFIILGFFIHECTSLHVSFEGRLWASLIITVLFLIASFGIVSFDATEETESFFIAPFLFFFCDSAPLGFKVSVVNLSRGSILLGGGGPSAETSPVPI